MEKNNFVLGPIQEAWLQSLEQHPERQMRHELGRMLPDGSYKACCLGEYGLIAGICEWTNGDNGEKVLAEIEGYKYTETLKASYSKVGLKGEWGNCIDINGKRDTDNDLQELNDRGTSWPEIAAIVRANPTSYFTHSV